METAASTTTHDPDVNVPGRIEAGYMAIDGLTTPDVFLLWALRQRLSDTDGHDCLVSTAFRRVLGSVHATPALAALEAACRVLADHGVRPVTLLPPSCGFITHDEACLLSLCGATQSGSDTSGRRQADALVGPVWSPFLFASLERFTGVLARRSLLLSSTAAALRRAFH